MTEKELKIKASKINTKISVLKAYLRATDYKAIKFAEGEITAEEYAETKEKRRAWRAEINTLQAELKELINARKSEEGGTI